jgi:hypothetical protein
MEEDILLRSSRLEMSMDTIEDSSFLAFCCGGGRLDTRQAPIQILLFINRLPNLSFLCSP